MIVLNSATSLPTSSVVYVVVQDIWLVIVLSDGIPMLSLMIPLLHLMGSLECQVLKVSILNMLALWQSLVKGAEVVGLMISPNHLGVPTPLVYHKLPIQTFLLGVVPRCGNLQVSVGHRMDKLREDTALLSQAIVGPTEELPEPMAAHPKDMDKAPIQVIKHHMDNKPRITLARTHSTISNSTISSNPHNKPGEDMYFSSLTTTHYDRFIFFLGGGNDAGRYIGPDKSLTRLFPLNPYMYSPN